MKGGRFMENVTYQGKTYPEPNQGAQEALADAGIYTIRYYPQDKMMMCSDATVSSLGCKKIYAPIPQDALDELIVPEDAAACVELFEKIDRGEKRAVANLRGRADGALIRVSLTLTASDPDGKPLSAIGLLEKLNDESVSAELVRALSDDYHSIYFIDYEKDEVIPYRLGDTIEREYGSFFRSRPTYESAIISYIRQTVLEEDQEEMLALCDRKNLHDFFRENKILIHDYRAVRDGRIQYCRMKIVSLSPIGAMHRAIYGFSDIDREKTKELERYAYTDPVTGGDNYVRFKKCLADKTEPGYILSMDIHSFKVVNSICGTTKGDEILREIWKCIKQNIGTDDLAAHINADHFIIYYALQDREEVARRLEMISIQLSKRSTELGVPQQVPYFGVAEWNPDKKIEQTYNEANIARHEVKHRQDINHAFFSQQDANRILQEKQMEDAFESSMRNRQFEIWYQPKYHPGNNKLVGAEALVRWRDDKGELVPPGVFIPLFERNGMIRYLDEYVFRNVCLQQKKWMDEKLPLFPISVNLSRASLYFQSVVERYKKITEEIGIDPKYVPIEITETAAVDNKAIDQLADSFCTAGFPLHIDDFGAGYSSFAALNTMHFDTLKIDKSLIDYIGNYGGDRLLEHTIALAKDLGMHVTAEGVETDEQVSFLQKLNCDSIQGFYYSRPLPLEEFEKIR